MSYGGESYAGVAYATLDFTLDVAFVGAGTSTGAFAGALFKDVAFAGAGTSTGTFAVSLQIAVTFSGAGTSTGTFAGALFKDVAFAGAGTSAGSFTVGLLFGIAFAGAGSSTGAFAAVIVTVYIATFSGAGSSSGSFAAIVVTPLDAAFVGAGLSTGAFDVIIAAIPVPLQYRVSSREPATSLSTRLPLAVIGIIEVDTEGAYATEPYGGESAAAEEEVIGVGIATTAPRQLVSTGVKGA